MVENTHEGGATGMGTTIDPSVAVALPTTW
jgi:hypothetical protein